MKRDSTFIIAILTAVLTWFGLKNIIIMENLTGYPSMIAEPISVHESGLNKSTCLWIHFNKYTRSGNMVLQIMDVKELLSRCSGVASSDSHTNGDPALAFPPVIFATHTTYNDPSILLAAAAQECQEVSYTWDQVETLARSCSPHPVYKLRTPVNPVDALTGTSSPMLLANVFADHAFWKSQVTTLDTMVMYFRGGDVLREDAHPDYSQGPCSLFLESWKAANVSRAVLVYDHDAAVHPCVEVVRETIGDASIVPTPCDSVGCHMMIVGRARYIVVSGCGTFAPAGFMLFPDRRRVIFSYFCDDRTPRETIVGLHVCVKGASEALRPWTYTSDTRQAMLELPSQVVLGNMTTFALRKYLQQRDDEHMDSRLISYTSYTSDQGRMC